MYWFIKTFIVGPFANSVFRPWSRGDENVPPSGAVIFVSNHLSFVDSVFLPLALKRPISFLAKSEYFTGSGVVGWLTKITAPLGGTFSSPRDHGRKNELANGATMKVFTNQ